MRRGSNGGVATAAAPSSTTPAAGGNGVCTALPLPGRTANVTGTANAPVGHWLRKPGSKPVGRSPIGWNPGDEAQVRHGEEQRAKHKFEQKLQEEQRCQWRTVKDEIRKRVELGMEAYEQDVEERREKLRKLLVCEEAQLTRELVEKARKIEEQRVAELEIKAADAAAEAEYHRLALLREKQLQHYVESNAELREARRRAWAVDTKRANRAQIAEIEERRKRERADEAFWHDLANSRSAAERASAAASASKRAELELATAQKLCEQIREREQLRQLSLPAQELEKLPWREESEESPEQRRARRQKLREDLDRQLAEARENLRCRQNEERALDEMTAIFAQPEPAPDQLRLAKQARHREMLAFMESMKEFREALERREAEAEECAARLAAEAELRRREAKRRADEDKARLRREVKLAWDRQLEEKQARRLLELRADKADVAVADPTAVEAKERAQRLRAAREYGQELLAQRELVVAHRAQERRRLEETVERQREAREREERLLAELAQRSSRFRICGTS